MRARCGRCGTGFDVMGPGRYACATCGVTNEVRGGSPGQPGAGPQPGPPGAGPQGPMAAPPPPPERPSQRARCPDKDCGFSFIVGEIAVAPCPMCGTEVRTGRRAGRGSGSR